MTSTSLRSSSSALQGVGGRQARVLWTGRAEGDLGLTADEGVERRRAAVWPAPWSWLHQVHGAAVHVVDRPGGIQGADGDGLVTSQPGVAMAVFTADCAPVAFTSHEGVVGVAHAGWRGLVAGVVDATVETMRRLGATQVEARLGPCIHAECYEFGERDLDTLAARFGDGVRSCTTQGSAALDLPAVVRAAVSRAGATMVEESPACTACSTAWFSHRARRDTGRQATLVVRES